MCTMDSSEPYVSSTHFELEREREREREKEMWEYHMVCHCVLAHLAEV